MNKITIKYIPDGADLKTVTLSGLYSIEYGTEFIEIKTDERTLFITVGSLISIEITKK